MNLTDDEINDHILSCNKKYCKDCSKIKALFFPVKRAQLKYRQTEKYKAYRKEYYKKNKERMNEQSRLYRLKIAGNNMVE